MTDLKMPELNSVVVAWNKLAESYGARLRKGNAVLVDGKLQSDFFKNEAGRSRDIVKVRARHIPFLNKKSVPHESMPGGQPHANEEEQTTVEDDSFDKFLTSEEAELLKEQPLNNSPRM